jgi:hypothetical protein
LTPAANGSSRTSTSGTNLVSMQVRVRQEAPHLVREMRGFAWRAAGLGRVLVRKFPAPTAAQGPV